jgi:hypothetical protein
MFRAGFDDTIPVINNFVVNISGRMNFKIGIVVPYYVNISYGNESEDDVKVKRKIVLEG